MFFFWQVLKATADPTPIKQVLNSKTEYGPAQVEHCLLEAEITPNTKITAAFADGHADAVQRLLTALQGVDRLIAQPEAAAGYVYKVQPSGPRAAEAADGEDLVYEHFSAFPLRQYGAEKFVVAAFPTFTAAVDDYFSKFEDQRATSEVEVGQFFLLNPNLNSAVVTRRCSCRHTCTHAGGVRPASGCPGGAPTVGAGGYRRGGLGVAARRPGAPHDSHGVLHGRSYRMGKCVSYISYHVP